MKVAEFFAKYPTAKECFMSPDGELHFNQEDADLHSRIRNLEGQSQLIKGDRAESPIQQKTSKKL